MQPAPQLHTYVRINMTMISEGVRGRVIFISGATPQPQPHCAAGLLTCTAPIAFSTHICTHTDRHRYLHTHITDDYVFFNPWVYMSVLTCLAVCIRTHVRTRMAVCFFSAHHRWRSLLTPQLCCIVACRRSSASGRPTTGDRQTDRQTSQSG